MEHRSLPVPDGLDGVRVDAGLAKLLGFSRTQAAEIASAGGRRARRGIRRQVRPPARGRLARGELGAAAHARGRGDRGARPRHRARRRRPRRRRQAGRRGRAPVARLERADRRRRLAAAGFRISTSGAPERQGVVHRLDAGTSGLMVVAKSERAYTELKRQFHDREVEKIYHTVVQGIPIRSPARSTRPSAGIRAPSGSSRSPPTASTR